MRCCIALWRCTRVSNLCVASERYRSSAFGTHSRTEPAQKSSFRSTGTVRADRRGNKYSHSCCAAARAAIPFCKRFASRVHATAGDHPTDVRNQTADVPLKHVYDAAADTQHTPVLLKEVLGAFEGLQLRTFVDGTLGAGGHSCATASAHKELRTLIGIDQDETAFAIAAPRLEACGDGSLDIRLHRGNFRDMQAALQSAVGGSSGVADGILLDLGVSSMQLDQAERGFSFMRDGPLDMRMGGGGGGGGGGSGGTMSAEALVNTADEAELGRILREWGEERAWRRIATRIIRCREEKPIRTTQQLVAAIGGGRGGGRGRGGRGIHPATRTFQALRIAVNDELGALREALPAAVEALAPGGRLAVISFHSLEDRIVKRALLAAAGRPQEEHAADPQLRRLADLEPQPTPPALGRILTKRPVTADAEEQRSNTRSRSAKLRVLEKLPLHGG